MKKILIFFVFFTFLLSSCSNNNQQATNSESCLTTNIDGEKTMNNVNISLDSADIVTLGRTIKNNKSIHLNWTNSGFSFSFKGTGASVSMGSIVLDVNTRPFIRVEVDGKLMDPIEIKGVNKYTLCENLAFGQHIVTVYKVTEISNQPLIASNLTIQSSQGTPELLASPKLNNRKLEFIGDSITCGYGNLGKPSSDSYKTAEQDGLQTYASFTAEHFGAQANYVCSSGKGIIKDCNGTSDMPFSQLFELLDLNTNSNKWEFQSYNPDVVVVNAGTNDQYGGTTKQQFTNGAVDFIKQINSKYKDTPIIWCYGMMNAEMTGALNLAVDTAKKLNIDCYFVPLDIISSSNAEIGSVGHPRVKAHKKASEKLITIISQITGW